MSGMTWKVPTPPGCRFTSAYGPRNTGIPGASTFHRGIDLAPPRPGQRGVPVGSVGPGRVSAVSSTRARGRLVRVLHDDGSETLYQHLDSTTARVGARVVAGQMIGVMGSTGVGAGVHLHFETYLRTGAVVDPEPFMRARGVELRTGATTISNQTPIGGTLPDAIDTTPITPLEEDDMPLTADDKEWITQAIATQVNLVLRQQHAPGAEVSDRQRILLDERVNLALRRQFAPSGEVSDRIVGLLNTTKDAIITRITGGGGA